MCWSIAVNEKSTVSSPFFEAFPSDRIPKARKDISVQKFPSCSNSCKLYQRIPGIIELLRIIYQEFTLKKTCTLLWTCQFRLLTQSLYGGHPSLNHKGPTKVLQFNVYWWKPTSIPRECTQTQFMALSHDAAGQRTALFSHIRKNGWLHDTRVTQKDAMRDANVEYQNYRLMRIADTH